VEERQNAADVATGILTGKVDRHLIILSVQTLEICRVVVDQAVRMGSDKGLPARIRLRIDLDHPQDAAGRLLGHPDAHTLS
jgi:hypothetical protein